MHVNMDTGLWVSQLLLSDSTMVVQNIIAAIY